MLFTVRNQREPDPPRNPTKCRGEGIILVKATAALCSMSLASSNARLMAISDMGSDGDQCFNPVIIVKTKTARFTLSTWQLHHLHNI